MNRATDDEVRGNPSAQPPPIDDAGMGGSADGEVLDRGLSVDEVPVIFGIEHGQVDVISSEGDDRLMVIPEADRQELSTVTIWSADDVRALIPRRCLVLDDAGAEDVLGVGVGVLGASPTSPGSHRAPP